MRSMLFISLLALAPTAKASDTAAVAPVTAAKPGMATADGDKLVCRREQVSGSNILGRRVCKLRRDLDTEQRAARDAAQQLTTPTGGSNSSN